MKNRLPLLAVLLFAVCCTSPKADGYVDWLYESMPLPDSLHHPRSWWEANVSKTLEVRKNMRWRIPEREFRHFVLPLRVNNESLDDFRLLYADTLCARVKGMSLPEAALEINHWCHEQASYEPSDARTSSPMATMRRGVGRCGEESVLAVAALRAAGIPARQVYTPRWAHTDDNHAWVEVWTGRKWEFMGACEPAPTLNNAWFNAPVSRALLLHTKVFGDYKGPEDVILRTPCYTEINVIRGYVPARRLTVTVVEGDTDGGSADGAGAGGAGAADGRVVVGTRAAGSADGTETVGAGADGSAGGTGAAGTSAAGLSAGGTGAAGTSAAGLSAGGTGAAGMSADGTEAAGASAAGLSAGGTGAAGTSAAGLSAGGGAPVEGATVEFKIYNYAEFYTVASYVTDESGTASLDTGIGDMLVWARKGERFGYAVASGSEVRISLSHTLGQCFSDSLTLVPPPENPIPTGSTPDMEEANARRLAMEDAIRASHPHDNPDALAFTADYGPLGQSILDLLSAKDKGDVGRDVLEDAVEGYAMLVASGKAFPGPAGGLDPYVAGQRIELEPLRPFRWEILYSGIGDKLHHPWDVAAWIRGNVRIVEGRNPQGLRIAPAAVWESRMADRKGRDIFFVALCRTLGFPSRIDPVTGKVQYREGASWIPIDLDNPGPRPSGLEVSRPSAGGASNSGPRTSGASAGADGGPSNPSSRSSGTSAGADGGPSNSGARSSGLEAARSSAGGASNSGPRTSGASAGADSGPSNSGARSSGLESARSSAGTRNGPFIPAPPPSTGLVKLSGAGSAEYYRHYTLTLLGQSGSRLLEYEEGGPAHSSYDIDEGYYLLTSGTRLADGSVLAHMEFFALGAGEVLDVPLVLPRAEGKLSVIGTMNPEAPFLPEGTDKPVSLLSSTGRGMFLLAILGTGDEPSNHAIHELEAARPTLARWSRPVVLLREGRGPEGAKGTGNASACTDCTGSVGSCSAGGNGSCGAIGSGSGNAEAEGAEAGSCGTGAGAGTASAGSCGTGAGAGTASAGSCGTGGNGPCNAEAKGASAGAGGAGARAGVASAGSCGTGSNGPGNAEAKGASASAGGAGAAAEDTPEGTIRGYDPDGSLLQMLATCPSEGTTLPVIALCDSFGRIFYISKGYNTSLASDLASVLK